MLSFHFKLWRLYETFITRESGDSFYFCVLALGRLFFGERRRIACPDSGVNNSKNKAHFLMYSISKKATEDYFWLIVGNFWKKTRLKSLWVCATTDFIKVCMTFQSGRLSGRKEGTAVSVPPPERLINIRTILFCVRNGAIVDPLDKCFC